MLHVWDTIGPEWQVLWGEEKERTLEGGFFLFFCPVSYAKNYKAGTGFVKIKNAVESGGVTETLFRIFDFNLRYLCRRQERKFAVRHYHGFLNSTTIYFIFHGRLHCDCLFLHL